MRSFSASGEADVKTLNPRSRRPARKLRRDLPPENRSRGCGSIGDGNEKREVGTKKKGFTGEQIIGKLRELRILLGQGSTVSEVSRKLNGTEQTYYRWRRKYGGLKRLVADLTFDNAILKVAARGNF